MKHLRDPLHLLRSAWGLALLPSLFLAQALSSTVQAAESATGAAVGAGTPALPAAVGSSVNSAGNLVQVVLGLALVLALMFGVAWVMKRFGMARTSGAQAVKLIGGVSVGNRERVLVVEVADQWIVVGVAPGRVNALATLPRQAASTDTTTLSTPNQGIPAAKNFSAWLKQKTESHGQS